MSIEHFQATFNQVQGMITHVSYDDADDPSKPTEHYISDDAAAIVAAILTLADVPADK